MSKHHRAYIVGIIGYGIIVNDSIDQRILHYDNNRQYKRRQLKAMDNESNLEWCSYPYVDPSTKDFTAVAQFEDEEILLNVNPFIVMGAFSFYRYGIMDNAMHNEYARYFIKEYLNYVDGKHGNKYTKSSSNASNIGSNQCIFTLYLSQLFSLRCKYGVNRKIPSGKSKVIGTRKGIYIPSAMFKNAVLPIINNNEFAVNIKRDCYDIGIPSHFIISSVCKDGIMMDHGDGSRTEIVVSNDKIIVSCDNNKNRLMLKEFQYVNQNRKRSRCADKK